jgi:phospholipase C
MPEQLAFDKGLMDMFPKQVGAADSAAMQGTGPLLNDGVLRRQCRDRDVDYAQHFAMSDNSFDSVFGPSTPGALNLISGQTNGISTTVNGTGNETDGSGGSLTIFGDADPYLDMCSGPTKNQVEMKGQNIGDLLSHAGVTWAGSRADSI